MNVALRVCLLAWVAMLCAALIPVAVAQNYAITKYTIDGGGGASAGGNYVVQGTIGQPDASEASTGGKYAVTGGFWAKFIQIVPTKDGPQLTVRKLENSMVELKWKDPDNDWALTQSKTLKSADWGVSTLQIKTSNGEKSTSLSLPSKPLYFRLQKKN